MRPSSTFKTLTQKHPKIGAEIGRGNYFLSEKNLYRAAEKYKIVGKLLLEIGLIPYAIEFYEEATKLFIQCERYLKAINTQIIISELHSHFK